MAAKFYDGNKKNAVGEIILPNGTIKIKEDAFRDCDKLEKVILPDT